MKNILITGAAGFIGFHLAHQFLKQGYHVIGLDNLNNYYNVRLKFDRLQQLGIPQQKASYYNKLVSSTSHLSAPVTLKA